MSSGVLVTQPFVEILLGLQHLHDLHTNRDAPFGQVSDQSPENITLRVAIKQITVELLDHTFRTGPFPLNGHSRSPEPGREPRRLEVMTNSPFLQPAVSAVWRGLCSGRGRRASPTWRHRRQLSDELR